MHFVFIYENRRVNPVEMVFKKGERGMRENDGGGKSKIYYKHICKYHIVSCTTITC
jgi:hypothetical protein